MYKPQRRPSFDKIPCVKLKTYMWIVFPLFSTQSLQYVESGRFPFLPSDFPNSHFDVFMWGQPWNSFWSETSMFVWEISLATILRIQKEPDQNTLSFATTQWRGNTCYTPTTHTHRANSLPTEGSQFTISWAVNSCTDRASRSSDYAKCAWNFHRPMNGKTAPKGCN